MTICGVDEVGRGCWAGPLVVGAVVLKEPIAGLRDSKKLSKNQREKLAAEIQVKAGAVGLGWVQPLEIDELGLTTAIRLAMRRALAEITIAYDELVIDGNFNFFPENAKTRALIKADDLVPAVSAASIVAKVARDKFMAEQAVLFPGYGFEKHVGYGTPLHVAGLHALGACQLHRQSFKPIKAFLEHPAETA